MHTLYSGDIAFSAVGQNIPIIIDAQSEFTFGKKNLMWNKQYNDGQCVGYMKALLIANLTLFAAGMVLTVVVLPAPAPALAQSKEDVSPLNVEPDEIRLDGRIGSIDRIARELVVEVDSFTLPTGKTSLVTPPKSKVVRINQESIIHVRGDATRTLGVGELDPGAHVIVVGKDSGSGNALTARWLAVWSRQQNGQFGYESVRIGAPVAIPPPPVKASVQSDAMIRTLGGYRGPVWSVSVAPKGEIIAAAGDNPEGAAKPDVIDAWGGEIKIWDRKSAKPLRSIKEPYGMQIMSLAFGPDGRSLVSGSLDGTAHLWDVYSGRLVREMKAPDAHGGGRVAYSPDGKLIAAGYWDHKVRLWSVQTGSLVRTRTGHSGWLQAVAFSPDSRRIASGGTDTQVHLWETHTGKTLRILKGHTRAVTGIVFSRSGSIIASGSDDKTIRLWDAQSGKLLKTLDGNSDWIHGVAFSPDGALVAGGTEKIVRVWDVKSGRLLKDFIGHKYSVQAVAFTPDGKGLVSAAGISGKPGEVLMWALS